jgi:glycosyltransferase involved in cell wall biosynthesis
MKILHVVSNLDPESGGPAEALRGLATAQAKAGLGTAVLATWKRGADLRFVEELKASGVAVHLIGPCYGPFCWRQGLARTTRELVQDVDVVHIHALWEDIQHQSARAAQKFGKPYIIRACGMLDPWSLSQGRWKKAIYMRLRLRGDLQGAAALHFTTAIERDLTQSLGLATRAIVEPNGIRIGEFESLPERGKFRSRFGIPDTLPVCLFLSRVHPKKGLDFLLPAFAALKIPAHLVIAGPVEAGYRTTLESEISRLQLEKHVQFVGMLRGQEKLSAFVDADLFVLPSRQENFGNAVVEALAAGLPVVISDQVNLWPEIRGTEFGSVVPLDVKAIADELSRWLSDREMRVRAARQALSFARARFDWDAIARRWAGHYAGVVHSSTE